MKADRAIWRGVPALALAAVLAAGCATAAKRMGMPDFRQWTVRHGDGDAGPSKPAKNAPAADPAEADRERMAFFRDGWTCEGAGDHWLQIDWGRAAMVYGFEMRWGDAFPADYDMLLSRDGKRWEIVREKRGGAGGTDFWVVAPRPARAARLVARLGEAGGKATLARLRIVSTDTRPQVRVDGDECPGAVQLLDGDAATAWTFGEPGGEEGTVEIAVDWGAQREMHGVEIDWAEGQPRPDSVEVSASADGVQWMVLGEGPPGAEDPCDVWVTETARRVRHVKLRAKHGGDGFAVAGVSLRGPGEAAAAWKTYAEAARAVAGDATPGVFLGETPRWTLAAGLEDRAAEALFSAEGAWSPGKGAPSLWPLVRTADGRTLAPRGAAEAKAGAAEPGVPMPTAEWTWDGGLKLSVRVMAAEGGGSWAEYVLENGGEEEAEGWLAWVLRPLRIPPPEAGGGIAPVTHVKAAAATGEDGAAWQEIRVNGAPYAGAPGTALAFAAAASRNGGPTGLASGEVAGTERQVRDRDGLAGALWSRPFRLEPGGSLRTVLAMAPWPPERGERHPWPAGIEARFDDEWRARAWAWRLAGDGYAPAIERPARMDLARAQLAWILGQHAEAENPEVALWRLETLLCAGRADVARKVAGRWVALAREALAMDGEDGEDVNSRRMAADRERATLSPDVCGQFLFGMMETWRFAGDDAFLEEAYPVMRRAMLDVAALTEAVAQRPSAWRRFWRWIRPWRRKPPEVGPAHGLVADRAAGEGGEAVHQTTSQLWALLGWKELRQAAERLGFAEDAAWADSQYRALREAFRWAIAYATRDAVHPRIPPSIEAPDALGGTSAAALLFWPCGEGDLLPAAMVQNTLDGVYARFLRWAAPREGTAAGEAGAPVAAWIGDVRYLPSFSRMGHGDYAREMLFAYADLCDPPAWGAMPPFAAAPGSAGAPAAWRPDVQTAALLYLAMRHLAVCEDGGRLHLLCGLPPEWVQQGRGFRVAAAPTAWGALDLDAVLRRRLWRVKIGGTARPPDGYRLWWPLGERPERVLLNRTAAPDASFDVLGIDLPSDFSGTVEAFFAEDVPAPREP